MTGFSLINYLESALAMPALSAWVGALLLAALVFAMFRNVAPAVFVKLTAAEVAALIGRV